MIQKGGKYTSGMYPWYIPLNFLTHTLYNVLMNDHAEPFYQ